MGGDSGIQRAGKKKASKCKRGVRHSVGFRVYARVQRVRPNTPHLSQGRVCAFHTLPSCTCSTINDVNEGRSRGIVETGSASGTTSE